MVKVVKVVDSGWWMVDGGIDKEFIDLVEPMLCDRLGSIYEVGGESVSL